jgi:hypothetical protein
VKEETFQLATKQLRKIKDEEFQNKYFVINWFNMKFYDADCKMIQFVDIS